MGLSSIDPATIAEVFGACDPPEGVASMYLFGSARRAEPQVNDVDLLVVYRAGLEKDAGRTIRRPVERALEAKFHLPVHLLLLSENEVKQTGFVETEDAVEVWPSPALSD